MAWFILFGAICWFIQACKTAYTKTTSPLWMQIFAYIMLGSFLIVDALSRMVR